MKVRGKVVIRFANAELKDSSWKKLCKRNGRSWYVIWYVTKGIDGVLVRAGERAFQDALRASLSNLETDRVL